MKFCHNYYQKWNSYQTVTMSSNKTKLVDTHQTLAYLEEHCCKFLKPNLWPNNNPDLHHCDYAIWGILEGKIWKNNQFQIMTLEDLKEWIIEEWDALPQDVIYRSINLFRKHVHMVIKKNGGHIEKYI